MTKRIGILTYFGIDNNPGTFLQAYGSLLNIKSCFPDHEVNLINYRFGKTGFVIGRRHLIEPVRLYRDYQWYRRHKLLEKTHFEVIGDELISIDYDQISDYIKSLNLDMIIVGADTLLQFLPQHRKADQLPIFWLPESIDTVKIFCSASCGGLDLDTLKSETIEQLKKSARDFSLLGVRDDATYTLMEKLGFTEKDGLTLIPDPTFLLDIDYSYIESWMAREKIKFRKPVVAINLPISHQLYNALIDYYHEKGFEVASLSYHSNRSDYKFRRLTPFEWSGIHKYFSLIITDRFHGSLYALKNSTPVVALDWEKHKVTSDGFSKTYSLMKMFGLENTNHIPIARATDLDYVLSMCETSLQNFDRQAVTIKYDELAGLLSGFLSKLKRLI